MVRVWRVSAPEFVASAFSGAGAEQTGGRFNSRGRRPVYASGSLALAVLESLVQAGARSRLRGYVCIPADIPENLVARAPSLPAGWDSRPYGRSPQEFGDAWLDSGAELALLVPSVVVPQEFNLLLNPDHEAFCEVVIGKPVPFPLDPRLG